MALKPNQLNLTAQDSWASQLQDWRSLRATFVYFRPRLDQYAGALLVTVFTIEDQGGI